MKYCGSNKNIEEGLDHKKVRVTTVKHLLHHRIHRYQPVDKPKNNLTEFLYSIVEQQ